MIELSKVKKVYGLDRPVHALRGVDLAVDQGEYMAIMGPSGSGKSTLMNILGCLDRPTSGRYLLDGQDVSGMSDDRLAQVRNKLVGFVFQTFNLLPRQTALRNVELPLVYRKLSAAQRRRTALEVLDRVGLREWAVHRPNQLSGGQQQRVAIARGLVGHPAFLLADEPTGNLDSRSGQEIMLLFEQLNSEGVTVVVVTHDERIARHARRIVQLFDGYLTRDAVNPAPLDAQAELARLKEEAARAGQVAQAGPAAPGGLAAPAPAGGGEGR